MKLVHRSALAAVAFGSLSLAGTAWAASGATGSGTPLGGWEEGKVQSVDTGKGEIAFGDQSTETNTHTLIVKDGDPASLGDIQPGDDVRASFLPNDPFHAARIEVTSPRVRPSSAHSAPGASNVLPGWYSGEESGAPSAALESSQKPQVGGALALYPAWYSEK